MTFTTRNLIYLLLALTVVILPINHIYSQANTAAVLISANVGNNDSILNLNFEKYRQNLALLRIFCKDMPKGGDLHHHFSGALFPEYFINTLIRENLYINPQKLIIKEKLKFDDVGFVRVSKLIEDRSFEKIREQLLRSYSARNFHPNNHESKADFFFNTFSKFAILSNLGEMEDLLTLKKQAMDERVSYIETMFPQPPNPFENNSSISNKFAPSYIKFSKLLENFDAQLLKLETGKNDNLTTQILTNLLDSFKQYGLEKIAFDHAQHIQQQHESLALDDDFFTLRYLNYAIRTQRPSLVFWDLALAFLSANKSDYIVGVNLVGPEHNSQALKDYDLHMRMCKFLRTQFKGIKLSLHAGELTPTLATPLQLSSHINLAINLAGAQRIGHGVDISYENNAHELLKKMALDSIAIEINLSSNAFILSIEDQMHPVNLYHHYKVPIVIGTDDPGILRTTLTDEYANLAYKYPQFKYTDLKQLVLNSIKYSFLPPIKKQVILKRILRDFLIFENKYLNL